MKREGLRRRARGWLGPYERLAPYLARHRGLLALGAVLLVATNLFALVIPWLFKLAVDSIEAGANAGRLGALALGIVAAAVAAAAVRILSRLAVFGAGRHIEFALRSDLFARLLALPPSFFQRMPTGEVVSRSLNDLGNVRMVLGPGLLNAVNTAVVYVMTIAAMLLLSPRLTALGCLPYPALAWIVWRFVGRLYANSKAVQERLADVTSRVQENLAGMAVVKAYGRRGREEDLFARANLAHLDAGMRYVRTQAVLWPLMASFGSLGVVLVLWFGGRMVIRGSLGLGDLVAFVGYLGILTWPTFALGWILSIVERGRSSLARLGEIMESTSEVADPPGAGPLAEEGPAGIEVSGLRFAYPGEERPVLDGIDLAIRPGTWVAIVGRTGAGKSTLLKLLPRLYRVPPGAIRIGGTDVAAARLASLRRSIAFVPQEPMLFSMSVADNVAFGAPGAGMEAIRASARAAAVEGDVAGFPHGWASRVGERGVLLSMGQRQRIALARALLKRASIYLLDDPFSSVDAQTEIEILASLREATRGATLVVATHRLEAARRADRIVVLEGGRVVQTGLHDELVAVPGAYRDLYRSRGIEEELTTLA